MNIYINSQNFKLELRVEDINTNSISFSPQISFNVIINYNQQLLPDEMHLFGVYAKVNLAGNNGIVYVGRAYSDRQLIRFFPDSNINIMFNLELNYYELEQIEKLRNGGEINFQLELKGAVMYNNQNNLSFTEIPPSTQLKYRVPKSDWTEKILKGLKYKKVWMLEVPELESPEEFKEAVSHLDSAWRQFSMGEYKNTLVDCRKALEVVGSGVKKAGFEKIEQNKNGEEHHVPDWRKFLDDKSTGKKFEKIFRDTWQFLPSGAHTGKNIDRGDANLALMTTHAIVYYAIRRFLEIT